MNSTKDQWNAKSWSLPCSMKYRAIIFVIYQKENVIYFNNKNVITLIRTKKKKKVDWVQIMFNNLYNNQYQWYKYVKENKGDKKDTCQSTLILYIYIYVVSTK
jgi:ADP-heptose:LPS heptosyltransferase